MKRQYDQKSKKNQDADAKNGVKPPTVYKNGTMQEFKAAVDANMDCVSVLDLPATNSEVPFIIQ